MKRYVALSGGIDSTALALLEPDAVPVFTDTGWEFSELYEQLALFELRAGRHVLRLSRGESLPQYIRRSKFLPGHASRFCTRMFKVEVLDRFLRDQAPCELLIGLRADEPNRVGNLSNIDGVTVRYPLRERGLTRLDVVRICLKHSLLPRYPAYMARGGCIGCFYKRASEVRAMQELVPEKLDELQQLEEAVQDERMTAALMFPNAGQTIARIRSQPRLMDTSELYRDASDHSDYGAECGLFYGR